MLRISRRNFLTGLSAASAMAAVRRCAAWAVAGRASELAHDPLRPQFHLLPAANWMNDPNGPIFFDGRYHMFYQYDPFGAFWGSMHWGHATSPDMVHWKHQAIAIAPTLDGNDRDGVFSGGIVLDHETPTAIYTGVQQPSSPSQATLRDGTHTWKEVQCLAVSRDGMRSWQKDPHPIIPSPPPGIAVTGFRDPCVWREGYEWKMALGSGVAGKGGTVLLYRSSDLHRWTYLHPLIEGTPGTAKVANPVDSGEMWECPDFFPLGRRHVLLISTMGKVFWKVGTYRHDRFTPEKEGTVDFGSYYAARTMLDRDGGRILWGWIPETRPEKEYREAGWAGVMSLPRVLTLGSNGDLRMAPSPAIEALRGKGEHVGDIDPEALAGASSALRIRDLAADLQISFISDGSAPLELQLRSEKDDLFAVVSYNATDTGRELSINDTHAAFAAPAGQPVRLRLLLDGSVLELFANDSVVLTARVYKVPQGPLRIVVRPNSRVTNIDLWPMKPISPDRLTS
jgi:beta-fructofuranosidase